MTKRSITDEEIALIKAMKARRMKNKDIQFFFNRPDRAVNSGRISNIAAGTYGGSAKIAAASNDTLDGFISTHRPTAVSASVAVPQASPEPLDLSPVSEAKLAGLFVESGGVWRLKAGEDDGHECKTNFGFGHAGKWLRAVAALANNRGGYVIFGVQDRDIVRKDGVDLSFSAVGLTGREFLDADTVKITQLLKATFDPTPRIQKATIVVGGKAVGVIYVDPHPSRPVIATKQADGISEGDIFYRYPAQSSRIKYSDLRALLDGRDAQARLRMLPMVEKLLAIGPEKALIADLEAGALGDGKNVIHLDPDLVDRLKFIKEGEFNERDGAPTLKLLGQVEAMAGPVTVLKKGFVTKADVIGDFLRQETPSDPGEYIRFLVEGTQGEWLPIHYFARQAGLDAAGLVAFINSTAAPAIRKNVFVERAKRNCAYHQAAGAGRVKLRDIESGILPDVTISKEVAAVASAIQALKAKPCIPMADLFELLARCIEIVRDIPKQAVMSTVRRAICRLDELFYGQES